MISEGLTSGIPTVPDEKGSAPLIQRCCPIIVLSCTVAPSPTQLCRELLAPFTWSCAAVPLYSRWLNAAFPIFSRLIGILEIRWPLIIVRGYSSHMSTTEMGIHNHNLGGVTYMGQILCASLWLLTKHKHLNVPQNRWIPLFYCYYGTTGFLVSLQVLILHFGQSFFLFVIRIPNNKPIQGK